MRSRQLGNYVTDYSMGGLLMASVSAIRFFLFRRVCAFFCSGRRENEDVRY